MAIDANYMEIIMIAKKIVKQFKEHKFVREIYLD